MRKNLFAGEGGSIYLFALCGASILSTAMYYILTGRTGSFGGMSVTHWVAYALTQVAFVAWVFLFSLFRISSICCLLSASTLPVMPFPLSLHIPIL